MKEKIKKIEEIIRKYSLTFWVSILAKAVLLAIALISGFTRSYSYFSVAISYGFLLTVLVPCFFINKKMMQKYGDNVEDEFKFKHVVQLYTSFAFITLFVAVVPINLLIPTNSLKSQPLLMMYIVFIPWAIIRFSYEIYRIIKYRKIVDPYFRNKSLVNLISVMMVVLRLFADFYNFYPDNWPLIITGGVMGLLLLVYEIGIVFWCFIIAIRGLHNKRGKKLEQYKKEKYDESIKKPLP